MVDFVERREMFGEDMEVEFFCDGCGLDKEECLCGKQKRMKEGRYEGWWADKTYEKLVKMIVVDKIPKENICLLYHDPSDCYFVWERSEEDEINCIWLQDEFDWSKSRKEIREWLFMFEKRLLLTVDNVG